VFNFQNSHQGHSSLTDLVSKFSPIQSSKLFSSNSFNFQMFGMRQRETGMTKYPLRNRQRVLTFAVTVALKEHDPK